MVNVVNQKILGLMVSNGYTVKEFFTTREGERLFDCTNGNDRFNGEIVVNVITNGNNFDVQFIDEFEYYDFKNINFNELEYVVKLSSNNIGDLLYVEGCVYSNPDTLWEILECE